MAAQLLADLDKLVEQRLAALGEVGTMDLAAEPGLRPGLFEVGVEPEDRHAGATERAHGTEPVLAESEHHRRCLLQLTEIHRVSLLLLPPDSLAGGSRAATHPARGAVRGAPSHAPQGL